MHTRVVPVCLLTVLVGLVCAAAAAAAPTELTVRIEGKDRTIFEGPIVTDGRSIQAASDTEPRHCDGTNNGAHPAPVPTPTAASVDAMDIIGQDFDGDWYVGFDDYFITRWGSDGQLEDDFAYWGILVNGSFTPVGGCQYEDVAGDEVLWVYDAFNSKPFLRLSAAADPSPAPGPALPTAFVGQGQPLALKVQQATGAMDGSPESLGAASGVQVAPVVTDPADGYQQPNPASSATVTTAVDGGASVTFATAGWHRIKATATGFVRSNRLDVCVLAAGASDCGPLPGDARVRGGEGPGPDPDPDPPVDPQPEPPAGPVGPVAGPAGPSTPAADDPVRLSAPVVARDWARGRVSVRWRVVSAGVGMGSFTIESRRAGERGWKVRARGAGQGASLRLPAGMTSQLRMTVVDALGRTTIHSLGSIAVPLDERSRRLNYHGSWKRAVDRGAWERTVARGARGASVSVRLAAGKPVLFVRGVKRRAVIQVSGGGKRERFRIGGSATSAGRIVAGGRRPAGVVTATVLSGTVALDGVASAP